MFHLLLVTFSLVAIYFYMDDTLHVIGIDEGQMLLPFMLIYRSSEMFVTEKARKSEPHQQPLSWDYHASVF